MSIEIYNSLKRDKEALPPPSDKEPIKMYTCGITAYDECHIGHARSLYIFDVIRRYLKYRGYEVEFVRNITDIDDKIINRANELKVDWKELVEKYIASYYKDIESLGIERGDFEPRATENISDMVDYIKALIDKGYAYESGGDVYFEVRKFSGYGKLSGQSIEKMREGVRIEPHENKKDALDFALWKKSKENEPSWESPWGKGRPGWHIECSVMSRKFLKTDTLDIHAGGRDLIFPHHENEIAQAEALTGKPFAKYWLHHGLLTINGQKMSKSAGNFVTIKNVLEKYPADVLKIFYLQAHYSSPVDFSWEKMEEANRALQRFEILFRRTKQIKKAHPGEKDRHTADFIEKNKKDFLDAMDDDFNTPAALASLFEFVNDTNRFIDISVDDPAYTKIINEAESVVKELANKIFGILYKGIDETLSAEEKVLLENRKKARKNKDFKRSDKIRKELEATGIVLEDTKDGTIWRRKL